MLSLQRSLAGAGGGVTGIHEHNDIESSLLAGSKVVTGIRLMHLQLPACKSSE